MKNKNDIDITGKITIYPNLKDYDLFYLLNFYKTVHFNRDSDKLMRYYNGGNGYNGKYGEHGEFFIRLFVDKYGTPLNKDISSVNYDDDSKTILDGDNPGLPTRKCPWYPTVDGLELLLDSNRNEKNYQWLIWMITNIFTPNGYKLNGEISITTEANKRTIKLVNNTMTYSMSFEKRNDKKIKNNVEIIDNLIELSKKRELKWDYNISGKVNRYSIEIPIKKNFIITFSLYYSILGSVNNFINVYLTINNKKRLYRTIKSSRITKIIGVLDSIRTSTQNNN